jgi:uncharacterized protein
MRKAISMLSMFAVLAALCSAATAADPAKIRVLLITGDDVGAHPWREISEGVRADLVKAGKFDVKVCEDPAVLDSANLLKPYDVIVFTIYTTDKTPMISDQAKENLLNFVKEGKGFFVQHLASASFASWDEFGKLCGRKWIMGTSGHGPRSVFETKIAKKDHPITKGMEAFKVDDELYAKLQGDTPIEVLIEADSDWSKKTEPLVFTHQYGKGRVVHNAFGHDGKVMADPNVAKIIARGVEFAATGKVSD